MAAPNVLVDTTFSGKNISSAISVYEYTVAATGTFRIQVRLAAVAGNGDYVAYLTLNDGDAQTDDPMLPKTTLAAASGETAFWFSTISIDAIAGDVINVFVDGLAGDTDESGSIRIFSDNALAPTTAGRTLDVTAGGEAGLDWSNIGAPTTVVGLSGTTVKTATDLDFSLTRGTSPAPGAVNQITLENTALGVAGSYVHNMIVLIGGTGIGQARLITAYTAGRVATVVPNFDVVPANDTVYAVLPIGQSYVNEFSAGAITAAAIATNAIDADALAADAVNEIVDQVWDEAIAGHLAAGSTGAKLNAAGGAITFPSGAINYTYTITDSVTGLPIEGVEVWFSTDNAGANVVWKGDTDAFGVARDVNGSLPALDAGTYYAWRQKAGYTFTDPDTEVVS